MGKKGLVISILSKLVDTSPSSSPGSDGGGRQVSPVPWPWPSCRDNPQTTSFRAGGEDEEPCCSARTAARPAAGEAMTAGRIQLRGAAAGEMYKTVNSVYFDSAADEEFCSLDGGGGEDKEVEEEEVVDDESCFSTTTASEEWSEAVIRSLGRSTSTHRFFFDPEPPAINSVPPASPAASPPANTTTTTPTPPPKPDDAAPGIHVNDDDGKEQQQQQPCASKPSLAEGSVAVAVDSSDPFGDFRASMEEMVAAHGLRDLAALEELLSWYLRVNAKHNHPLIVGAFVDLLIGLASSPPSTTFATTATTTTTSTSTGKSSTTTTTTTSARSTSMLATAAAQQCGGRGENEASRSSSSSSCAAPDDSREAEAEKAGHPSRSSDDDVHIPHHECEPQC